MQTWYVFTLDSHECFGPFITHAEAYEWAWNKNRLPAFQIISKLPYSDTVVRKPY